MTALSFLLQEASGKFIDFFTNTGLLIKPSWPLLITAVKIRDIETSTLIIVKKLPNGKKSCQTISQTGGILTMPAKTLQTPLYDWHVSQRANMARFGDYLMPMWYPTGAKYEHLAVLTDSGLFDTSHMAAVQIKGPNALEFLKYCVTKDLNHCTGKAKKPLQPGRCTYGAFLNAKGEIVDEAIIFQIDADTYILILNAGMGAIVLQHLISLQANYQVKITNLTGRFAKLDLQGPYSAKILQKLVKNPSAVFAQMPYFAFKGTAGLMPGPSSVELIDNTPLMVSRTGYTGEFGFELFVAPEDLIKVWTMIIDAGHVIPCGLAARDSLRAGAVLPLAHQDIGPWPFINHPWPFSLPFNKDKSGFTKTFVGDQALLKVSTPQYTYPFVGYDLRKVSVSEDTAVLDNSGKKTGRVLTCVTDMGIGWVGDRIYSVASPDKPQDFEPKGLCCGFILVREPLDYGQTVELQDQRRTIKVIVVKDIRPDRSARRPISDFL